MGKTQNINIRQGFDSPFGGGRILITAKAKTTAGWLQVTYKINSEGYKNDNNQKRIFNGNVQK